MTDHLKEPTPPTCLLREQFTQLFQFEYIHRGITRTKPFGRSDGMLLWKYSQVGLKNS